MMGAGGAIVLRVILTIVVAQLLGIKGLKLIGGLLIMWIALKLFIEGAPEEGVKKEPTTIWQAMTTIVIADIVMSLDNMLAVAGASHGNNFLIIFGLVLSIPFIVFTSNLLSMLMDKFPIIVYLGAMVLGKVAGEMVITDPYVQSFLHTGKVTQYVVEAAGAILVVVVGKLWMKMKRDKAEKEEAQTN
jgi:YjbE family integral membrane protein